MIRTIYVFATVLVIPFMSLGQQEVCGSDITSRYIKVYEFPPPISETAKADVVVTTNKGIVMCYEGKEVFGQSENLVKYINNEINLQTSQSNLWFVYLFHKFTNEICYRAFFKPDHVMERLRTGTVIHNDNITSAKITNPYYQVLPKAETNSKGLSLYFDVHMPFEYMTLRNNKLAPDEILEIVDQLPRNLPIQKMIYKFFNNDDKVVVYTFKHIWDYYGKRYKVETTNGHWRIMRATTVADRSTVGINDDVQSTNSPDEK